MDNYNALFKEIYVFLEERLNAVNANNPIDEFMENHVFQSDYEKDVFSAVADEVKRIADIEQYKKIFRSSLDFLKKYCDNVCDDSWEDIVENVTHSKNPFEVALCVASVLELERIYFAKKDGDETEKGLEKGA